MKQELLYQGSVKDIYQSSEKGSLYFEFSNRYSIFDWGEMPDEIPEKGKYLAHFTTMLFQHLHSPSTFKNLKYPKNLSKKHIESIETYKSLKVLKTKGLKTHFLGLEKENMIKVKEVEVVNPIPIGPDEFDYQAFKTQPTNTLIPLEVVFRLGCPTGSSYLKRNKDIDENSFLKNIVVDFYTKLEPTDRLLGHNDAFEMASLNENEYNDIIELTHLVALALENLFEEAGLVLWDGKLEFAFGEQTPRGREIILVDSLGPDELRISKDDIPLSKEILRHFYRDTKWHKSFLAGGQEKPAPITTEKLESVSAVYRGIYEALNNGSFKIQKKHWDLLKNEFKHIVIFGSGGREHAIAKHLARDKKVQKVTVIPGNPGMESSKIKTLDIPKKSYLEFCKKSLINLAIIGPEDLLAEGLVDNLNANGVNAFGPTKDAAKLESSKAYSKNFMHKYNIPTAKFKNFTQSHEAINFINNSDWSGYVVKRSGLAAGKGVVVCKNKEEARLTAQNYLMLDDEIVIEEKLTGQEVSYFALCLEEGYKILGHACDYKTLNENNTGPNTGGMGCFSPSKDFPVNLEDKVIKEILVPTLQGLKKEGISFKGMLFIGLMLTNEGTKVLEYNTRFGDPETQTLLPLVIDPLTNLLLSIATNNRENFNNFEIKKHKINSVHVVKTASGYPLAPQKGDFIKIDIDTFENADLYYAGVKKQDGHLFTNGGRVLGVTAMDCDKIQARKLAYQAINMTHFNGEHFRKDIGA